MKALRFLTRLIHTAEHALLRISSSTLAKSPVLHGPEWNVEQVLFLDRTGVNKKYYVVLWKTLVVATWSNWPQTTNPPVVRCT